MPEIQETKTVFIAWNNSDLTEGRGRAVPFKVCETYATAERLGKGQNVQGSNCLIREFEAVKIDGRWCAPVDIHVATTADKRSEEKRLRREAALQKAKDLGLSQEEIDLLKKS